MVETACQPVLKDHGSCWLECKHRFLLATPILKSFTLVWLLWRDNFAEYLLINRSHKPYTPTKISCLLLPSRAILISQRVLLVGAILLIGGPQTHNFQDSNNLLRTHNFQDLNNLRRMHNFQDWNNLRRTHNFQDSNNLRQTHNFQDSNNLRNIIR